jgi:hypothetical protein
MKSVAWTSSTSCFSRGLIFCFLLAGCASTLPKPKTYEEAAREVDARGPLVSLPVEQREGYEEGKSESIQKDQTANYSGILMDEKKVSKLVAIKAERDRRRTELEAISRKSEIQKLLYESTIDYQKAQLDARATWWERNKLWVGFTLGTVLGMVIVTGLTYGLTRGNGLATGSTAQPMTPFSLRY